jgi:nicotinamide-nucleotide amidase
VSRAAAAVLTVGTELTVGLQLDTNAPEISAVLTAAGFRVTELASVADDEASIASAIERLTAACALVVVTGGLGPTHDDITREAAARALSRPIVRDATVAGRLESVRSRHLDPEAASHVMRMADVLEGSRVLPAVVGTAPGQVVETPGGHLVLLPGPPREMRPLLAAALRTLGFEPTTAPVVLCTTGRSESDIQVVAQRVLAGAEDIELTVLARPGEVRVVLVDAGAGPERLASEGELIASALGEACVSTGGETLAEATLRTAREAGLTLGTAESCTGGMVAAALTDVPGSSETFLGGVVSYSNALKEAALGVDAAVLSVHGAVSAETAEAMATGCARLTGADVCVSITGIAGPGGGSADKPVGTVWFGIASPAGIRTELATYPGDRTTVRLRATAYALDLMRLAAAASAR